MSSYRHHVAAGAAALAAFGLAGCGLLPSSEESASPEPTISEEITTAASEAAEVTAEPSADAATQQAAMDVYVAALEGVVPSQLEAFGDTYSAIDVRAIGNDTVEYIYTYSTPLDPAAVAAELDGQLDYLQSNCDSAVFPEMIANGIVVGPKVIFTYLNPDGSLLWTHMFEQSAA